MNKDLDELACCLKLGCIPESWKLHWQESQNSAGCVNINRNTVSDYLDYLDMPDEAVVPLIDAYSMVQDNSGLSQLAVLWHYLIYHLPGPPEDSVLDWPNPAIMGPLAQMFPLVAMISGLHHTFDKHRKANIPDHITRATLSDVGLWVRRYRREFGDWGFGRLVWLRRHARGEVYRVGRLQFELQDFRWKYRIFRNKSDRIAVLCDSGNTFRNDGVVNGTNGITDPDAWTSAYNADDDLFTGSPVSINGNAEREQVSLSSKEWDEIIVPGDDVLAVHIPSGEKMGHDECGESFRLAKIYFPQWFPDRKFKAFTCSSWLLDPALPQILPIGNIASFQKRWRVFMIHGSNSQAYGFVFGINSIDIENAPRETSLQRGIVDYVLSGGHIKQAAGFIIW